MAQEQNWILLNKYAKYWLSRICKDLKLSSSDPVQIKLEMTLGVFLSAHKTHPKNITTNALWDFLDKYWDNHADDYSVACKGLIALENLMGPTVNNLTNFTHIHLEDKIGKYLSKIEEYIALRNFSKATLFNYQRITKAYLLFLRKKPGPEDKGALDKYILFLRNQGQKPRTINLAIGGLKFFYRNILKTPDLVENLYGMKTGRNLPRVHSKENIKKLFSAAQNVKHKIILKLSYGCGLRLNELRLLRWQDVDFNRGTLKIVKGKGQKDRQVMLNGKTAESLKEIQLQSQTSEYVFINEKTKKPLSKRTIEAAYNKACKKGEINSNGGIHSLRHSFATHLMEQGVGLRQIQHLLGHSNSKTTEIYTHVSNYEISQIQSPLNSIVE